MYIYDLLLKCFDCIFPPSEALHIVRTLSKEKIISLYCVHQVDTIYILSTYSNKNIRALIHEAKFHYNTQACTLLSTLWEKYLVQYKPRGDMIIPIPLSRARMRTRGYNQVYEILRRSVSDTKIPIETSVLRRIRNTQPQTALKRADRLKNMHDAFGVMHGERISGKHILLVDDVMTTGTTLHIAREVLQKYKPASVTMIALAH